MISVYFDSTNSSNLMTSHSSFNMEDRWIYEPNMIIGQFDRCPFSFYEHKLIAKFFGPLRDRASIPITLQE